MSMTTLSRLVRIALYVYGLRPYVPSTVVFRLYWIAILSTAQVFQYRFVMVNVGMDDFSLFMDGVTSAMAFSLLCFKLVILWTNQRIFFDVLQMISADWQNHSSSNDTSHIMTKMANHARRASRWIIGCYIAAIIFYSVGVLVANANASQKLEPYKRELILKMELPFNISTDFIYTAVQIVQIYHLTLVAYGITSINSLLVSLILHVGGQIDILREWLLKAFSEDTAHSKDKISMQSLITKHQQIITFSENIENLYTYIALMILLSETIIICCLGFIIVTVSNISIEIRYFKNENILYLVNNCQCLLILETVSFDAPNAVPILIKSVLFYITMNLETFIYCVSGEYLSAKSQLIGNAAYESLWYNFQPKENRIILFVILRAQKRLTITSGRVMDLSLERFTSVLKASASYMSVLLAMY